MPRNNDLSNLGNLGPGQVPNGAVEDVSLKNPQRDTLPLIAHVNDPSRAHMASSTGIVDAGGFYSSDEVEGALQEIGGAFGGGRQNGIFTGFGYSALGLTVTFDTPSTALMPTVKDYSGEIITLPDNTPSIWVYISPATGLITQFVGANPPTITSPENVLLWQFTTLAGAITTARDARFYVRNIDRKLSFTVRSSGPQADQESEACFVTLDAALTYLTYSATLSSLRTEVVIRGAVNVTGPLVLPINGIHFRGEDGATLNLIGVSTTLINLNGKDNITFSDITFTSAVAAATAITDTVGGAVNFTMERCSIETGSQPWQAGIVFGGVIGRATLRDVLVLVTNTGISVANPTGVMIETCEVTAINFIPGSIGIRMGVTPATGNETPSTVTACTVSGFDLGIRVSGVGHVVTGCTVILGTAADAGVIVGDSQGVTVANCTIDCLTNSGKVGIDVVGTSVNQVLGLKLVGNTITGAAEYGIRINGFVQESLVTGNLVDCYIPLFPRDPTANAGIFVQGFGGANDVPEYLTITGNTVWRAKTGIYLKGDAPRRLSEILVSNNVVHHCAVGVAGVPPVAWEVSVGIGVEWGVGLSILNNQVYGIGSILKPDGTVVQPTPLDVYSEGILLVDCDLSPVQENKVRDLAIKGGGKSNGIQVNASGATALSITGSVVSGNVVASIPGVGIFYGIGGLAAPAATDLTGSILSGNSISDTETGISVQSLGRSNVTGCRIDGNTVNETTGTHGIEVASSGYTFATGTLTVVTAPLGLFATITIGGVVLTGTAGPRTSGADDFDRSLGTTALLAAEIVAAINDPANSFSGIVVAVLNVSTVELTAVTPGALGNLVTLTDTSLGITIPVPNLSGGTSGKLNGVEIGSNTIIKPNLTGVYVDCGEGTATSNIRVTNNVITLPGEHGIYFEGGDLVGFLSPNVFTGLVATGNQIAMDPVPVTTSGILLYAVINAFSEATISENTISDSYNGIKVTLTGPGALAMVADSILVSRNSLTGVRNAGIDVGVQGTLSQSDLTKNRVFNTVGSSQCLILVIAKAVASAAQSSDILIADNLLRPISGVMAIAVAISGMKTQNLRVEGNDVQGGLYGTFVSLANSATGLVPSINGLSVRGNTYSQTEWQGVVVTVPSASDEILNIDVSGNTFNQVAEDVGSASSAAILMTLQNTSRNLAVRDNQFYSCGRVGGTDGGITLKLNGAVNVGVTGNQFSGGSTGADYGFGNSVVIKGNAPGGFSLKDVDVSKNMVRNTSLGVIATLRAHIALDLANFSSAYHLSVDGNDIDRDPGTTGTDCVGVAVWGSAVDYYGLRVNDNRISGADLGTPLTQTAISLLVNSIDQGSVSSNYVSGTSVLGTQSSGITVTATSTSRALSVSNNKVVGETGVSGAGNYGISVSVSSGALSGSFVDENFVYGYPTNIRVGFTSSTILSVSNNESSTHENYGISIDCTGSIAANLSVRGNQVSTSMDTQTSGILVTTSNTGSFENLQVCENQIRYSGVTPDYASGQGVTVTCGDNISNSNISRNNVFTVSTGISVESVTSYGLSLDENTLQEGMLGIFHFSYTDIIGYSVSRNIIRCRADSTAGGLIYIRYNNANLALHNATIEGNDINGGLTVPTFTWGGLNAITVGTSGAEPNAISVSISDNTVRLSGNGIITEFLSSRALAVDRNKVDRLKQHGIKVQTATTGDSSEISLSGNLVSRWQQEASGTLRYGVAVSTGTAGSMFGISLVGNNVKGDESSSIGYDLDLPSNNLRALVFSGNTSMLTGGSFTTALSLATGATDIRNMSFTNNVFRGSTAGITYSAGAGTPRHNCVMGNIGDQAGSWSQFANGGAAGWLTGIPIIATLPSLFTDLNKDDGS